MTFFTRAKILLGVFILTVTVSLGQSATTWKVDHPHTSVNFTIKHFFSEVTGTFTDFKGDFRFDPANLSQSKIQFVIETSSVSTDNDKRDKHLQSEDFFDVGSFPQMWFISNKIEKKSESEFVALGDLTIRDKTKKVAIPFSITGQMEHPMMKGTLILGLIFETTINRTDFGVGTGDWAATMVVGDEIQVRIPMELNRKI